MRWGRGVADTLTAQASLGSWATPTTNDSLRSPSMNFAPTPNLTLNHMAVLSSWPTPKEADGRGSGGTRPTKANEELVNAAKLAGWGTPSAQDDNQSRMSPEAMAKEWNRDGASQSNLAKQSHMLAGWQTPVTLVRKSGKAMLTSEENGRRSGGGNSSSPGLEQQAELAAGLIPAELQGPEMAVTRERLGILAGWPTPMAGTPAQNGNNDSSRKTVDPCSPPHGPARLTAHGQLLTGSSVETVSGGQLAPEHSRWLMALPSVWDDCAVTAMQSLRKSPKSSSRRTSTSKE